MIDPGEPGEPGEPPDVDPTEFLRALLRIKPEDAAAARERASKAVEREDRKRMDEAEQ